MSGCKRVPLDYGSTDRKKYLCWLIRAMNTYTVSLMQILITKCIAPVTKYRTGKALRRVYLRYDFFMSLSAENIFQIYLVLFIDYIHQLEENNGRER